MAANLNIGTILAILNLHVAPLSPTKFGLNQTICSGADMVEDFQDGRAAILDIGTILTILNLYVLTMPPIKLKLNQTWGSGWTI